MPRTSNNQLTRQKLLDAGLSAFIKQGYNGTGIQQIVDGAGLPKGSFYNYFKSKEDFVAEVIGHYTLSFNEFLESKVKESENDAYSAIETLFDDLIKKYEGKDCKKGCLVGNFAAEISDNSELSRKTMINSFNNWRDLIKVIILRAQQQNSIREDIPADDISDFLLNSIEGALLRMKIEKNSVPLLQLKSIFLKFLEIK